MKFVFLDKSPFETDIITSILSEENISYKIEEHRNPIIAMPLIYTEIITYNIEVHTTLEYFDFINKLVQKK